MCKTHVFSDCPITVKKSNVAFTHGFLSSFCRFFGNSTGEHLYGPSLLEEGVPGAWLAVSGGFSAKKFGDRGGIYDWGQGGQKRQQEEDWVKNNSG